MKKAKRIAAASLVALAIGLQATRAQASTDTLPYSHAGKVGSIVAWIDNKQDPTAPTGLTDWENANTTSAQSDSVAVYRLVSNVNVSLQATTAAVLVHTTVEQPLATFYKITSDGNGTSATGFQAAQAGNGVNSFFYVGGGSTPWETAYGYTPGTFLGAGKTITHVNRDGQVLLTITVRGLNGEDLGTDSDYTEAPDVGTGSEYQASLTLIATAI